MAIELDSAILEQFDLHHEWVDVTEDDQPHSRIPPDKRYKCYVTVQVKAKWTVGELGLGRLTCDKGNEQKTVPNIGDFNKLKSAELPAPGVTPTFYVGNSYFPGFRHGGPVEFKFEILTQTTQGEAELRKENGRIVNRVRKSTIFRKVINIPAPPAM